MFGQSKGHAWNPDTQITKNTDLVASTWSQNDTTAGVFLA
jgi:hypothetical protein